VSPAEGGDPVAAGATKFFTQQRLDGQPSPDLWLSSGNVVIFTAKTGENTRLWTLCLSPEPWRVVSAPHRLTSGENDERTPSASPDGHVLFASRTQNIDIWSLPLNADAPASKGPLTRLTSDPSIDQRPSLSRDGKRIAWETSRSGNFQVWVKDLASGNEKGLTSGPLREHMPALSPDGSRLVYDVHDGEKVTIFESNFQGGQPVRIWEENVGQGSFQWTAKGDSVLYFHREPPGSVGLMNLSSKKRTVLLRHPTFNLSQADARLSPDGRWIAFPVPFAPHRSRLAVARVSGTVIENEREWTYLMPETMNSFQPEWSPSGRWLYFLSDQTGRLAVWALRLSAEMKPQAEARSILDFPGVRLTIAEMRPRDIGLAVAEDKLALAVTEYSGTIWIVRP
jgi:Tol biopolymer transport system component